MITWLRLALLTLAACVANPDPPATPLAPVRYADVTRAAGIDFVMRSGSRTKNYIVEAKGGGGAFLDYDADGQLDIYLVNGSSFGIAPDSTQTNALYRNAGSGTFRETTHESGSGDSGWGMGCAVADYDNDGDPDLYVTNYGPNVLYRNEGGTFAPIMAGVDLDGWSTSATFGDYDLDGDLDLYVAQYLNFTPATAPARGGMWKGVLVFAGPLGLPGAQDALYRNEGDGTFNEVTRRAKAGKLDPTYGLAALFCDYDDDGDPDIYVANDSEPNFLWQNQGDGTFRDVGLEAGAALSDEGGAQAGMGIAYDDYDMDGDRDLFVTHFEDDYNTLYQNAGNGRFAVASAAAGLVEPSLPHLAFGTFFLDYDNDRDCDLFAANGHVYPQIRHVKTTGYAEANQLFANQGPESGYRFTMVEAGDINMPNVSRGAASGDYDNDGDIDLLICNLDGPPALLRNDGGNQRNWLGLRLVGTTSNRDGVGAKVSLTAGGITQTREITNGGSFLSQGDSRAHFGLGFHTAAEQVEIHWPSGKMQRLTNTPANQYLVIEEP